jgi:hypothetical protein
VLSKFRARLVEVNGGERIFDWVLAAVREAGLLPVRGRARTDSTHVLAAIRGLNRLEFAIETLRAALNALAAAARTGSSTMPTPPGSTATRPGGRVLATQEPRRTV